jgi:predicted RNA-binding Zn-ribbon protein involved in translation (DUF1610 family)
MKLHIIATELGAATLASIEAPIGPIDAPEGWGLVFWGRCDRATFGRLLLSSKAVWIADCDINRKVAIVLFPPGLAGKEFPIDTTCVEAICPSCGASDYRSNGRSWECKGCGRSWLKREGKPKGGKRVGAGRKANPPKQP